VHGKRRPFLPKPAELAHLASEPPAARAHLPASLYAFPALNALISSCWQQRDLRRPTATEVHTQLLGLLQQLQT
jgi:hypothetical protein